ncbi:glutamate-1-semialdehyde 2,1-aminomutase [Ruficoccus amylovorans]|uniref:Glutamate-1-semialdehyde 2,1-aminomutase n=1 Tax=Ruficoccus amylovorans TaxID=1804625 RepID=A0A842HEH0_9BACT|nr:glutamate-1-semialdehyde 2,1-aminomutase [Ruficoccus amylovorans]MBC2593924.1 glutamate-1-semialdehyde 2,1-aminomutase [Ruficoccus amylovorans]
MSASDSPVSNDLFNRALKLIPGGVNSPVRAFRSVGGTPFFTQSAKGARLTTADGRELIDYVCTWGPAIHGHNHPAIREAVAEALERGTSFGTPNPYEVEMAELIVDMVPSVEKVRMVNSGTEATMSAIRLARGATGRDKIIKFAGCYHGHVDSLLVKAGSGALTLGNPDSAGIPASFAGETIVLPYNDLGALQLAFSEHPEKIAGVIIEPYPANCGLILPQTGYLEALRELCTRHGTVLIFDEVMTGFRIAPGGVQEKTGVTPDLTCLGKIIGGGLPVGAFGGRADLMDHLAPLGPVYQAGTLSGNPLAMAAGITALKLLREGDPYKRLESSAKQLAIALKLAAANLGVALQVPQAGSMFGLYFADKPVTNFDEALASRTELFKPLFQCALDLGVYLPPSAYEACFVSTAHTVNDIARTAEVLTSAIKQISESGPGQ